jgi:hypothetical protein
MDALASADPTHIKSKTDITVTVVEAMRAAIPPERVIAKIGDLMDATRPTKNGPAIDTRAVEVGVRLWLAYTIGLPTQRTENVNVNLDAMSGADMVERLVKSPALREQLRSYLAQADERVMKATSGRVVDPVEQ